MAFDRFNTFALFDTSVRQQLENDNKAGRL